MRTGQKAKAGSNITMIIKFLIINLKCNERLVNVHSFDQGPNTDMGRTVENNKQAWAEPSQNTGSVVSMGIRL